MQILPMFILGGALLLALVLGSVGLMCVHSRNDLVPAVLYGLPSVLLSLLIYVLLIEVELFWAGAFAVPSLVVGSLVLWRGQRQGQSGKDILSAMLVCAGIGLLGFILVQFPGITRVVLLHLLPPAPIL